MAKGPDFTGFGGYGPWPDNDVQSGDNPPSPHYGDGYRNRAPGGTHIEAPTDYWLDCAIYPERTDPASGRESYELEARARGFNLSVGNVTGRKPGPE